MLLAARREGFRFAYEHITAAPPNTFTFRTGPGHIYTSTQAYSFAVLTAQNGLDLEVHVGIRALGKSRVAHECDVIVLNRDEGVLCRANQVDPVHNRSELVVECKFYAAALGLGLLRSFLGLSADLGRPETRLVSNVLQPLDGPVVPVAQAQVGKTTSSRHHSRKSDLLATFAQFFTRFSPSSHRSA